MDDTKIWHLHGGRYDLSPFLDKHPGGKSILIATRGLRDATPLFESYHAFANRHYIMSTLEEYRLVGPAQRPLYRYDGLFHRFVQHARAKFGAKWNSDSVTSKVKANRWWWIKIISEAVLFCIMWVLTFVYPLSDASHMRVLTGFTTGFIFISLGFNTMHDASHFAIQPRNRWANGFFLRAWTAWALWSGSRWMSHHVVRHHGFTGHPELDPDTQHARPFIRKSLESPRSKYIYVPRWMNQLWHYAFMTASIMSFFPGMFVGQVLSYSLIWPLRGYLWKMPHPSKGSFDRQYWESGLSLLSLLSHFAFAPSLYASAGFFVGCNIAYAICILPDHDSFESAVENHLETTEDGPLQDWGEVQVRHSGDFGDGMYGRIFGELAGGINFQCVHHLIPGVSHVHFPELTEILEMTCKEMNVPYVRHPTLSAALWSVARTFMVTMGSTPVEVAPAALEPERPLALKPAVHRNRSYDAVTGMLFGAWLGLCALVIQREGRHLLVVPVSLVLSLTVHYLAGAFVQHKPDMKFRETRLVRRGDLLKASLGISSSLMLAWGVCFTQAHEIAETIMPVICLCWLGAIAAELFALVLSVAFKIAPGRVVSDTVKLALLCFLALKGPAGLQSTVWLTLEHCLGLLPQRQPYSLVIKVAQLGAQTLALSGMVASGSLSTPLALFAGAVLALASF